MRWKWEGKALSIVCTRRRSDKWSLQERRTGAQVVVAEGRNRVHDARGQSRKSCVEHAVADAYATLTTASKDHFQKSMLRMRGICQTKARSYVSIAGRCKSFGNTGISSHDHTFGRSRKESRVRTFHIGLQLVVFLPPGHDDIPTDASVERQVVPKSP